MLDKMADKVIKYENRYGRPKAENSSNFTTLQIAQIKNFIDNICIIFLKSV